MTEGCRHEHLVYSIVGKTDRVGGVGWRCVRCCQSVTPYPALRPTPGLIMVMVHEVAEVWRELSYRVRQWFKFR